ncbi:MULTISPECIES: DUF4149 domain-containing protein [Vitreoscilla]|uniref:DUF4149 domain-containing protein n=1 Tax=Vitreoscilla stercoraria TaxID=61 RepID=A0ABY4EDL3_VITST|nr:MULTISPECIES: DUF4149 domain-containing protein [Vitreoscilla]UOO93030.1 DUF4149 domain-containing protein [Vitreoscilla stercoraria]
MKTVFTLLHALWFGAHLMVGYVVAPFLFAYANDGLLDKQVVGNIAGDLFDCVMYLGLVVSLWWCVYLRQQNGSNRLAKALLGLLIMSQFVVTPVIVAIKQQQSHWLLNWVGGSFGMWHGISSSLYLLISILLMVLTWQRLQVKSRY